MPFTYTVFIKEQKSPSLSPVSGPPDLLTSFTFDFYYRKLQVYIELD